MKAQGAENSLPPTLPSRPRWVQLTFAPTGLHHHAPCRNGQHQRSPSSIGSSAANRFGSSIGSACCRGGYAPDILHVPSEGDAQGQTNDIHCHCQTYGPRGSINHRDQAMHQAAAAGADHGVIRRASSPCRRRATRRAGRPRRGRGRTRTRARPARRPTRARRRRRGCRERRRGAGREYLLFGLRAVLGLGLG